MRADLAIWFTAGVALGLAHAWVLWKAAQPPFRWAGAALLRLVPLAALFLAAAWAGGLIPVVVGWLIAFPLSVAAIALRKPT